MGRRTLTVGMITEVYPRPSDADRLDERLVEARRAGAGLALLPELPLNAWCPATRAQRAEDAEPPNGPRQQRMARAARESGLGLVGGAIVRDADGHRFNEACIYDAEGVRVGSYRKLHLPQEEGYWERSHYEPGDALPEPIRVFGIPFALQICSDANRPELTHALAAAGAAAVFVPRATPVETYDRWRTVLTANAVTSGCYIVSVNRVGPERDVDIGGPSLAIAPDGTVLVETEDPLACVELDLDLLERERREYPGYLEVRSELYAEAWRGIIGS